RAGAAARDGPRLLVQAPHEPPDDRGPRRGERRRRDACAGPAERAGGGAPRASGRRPAGTGPARRGAQWRQAGGEAQPEAEGERVNDGPENTSDRLPTRRDAHLELALVRDEGLRESAARGREDPAPHQGPAP